MLCSLVVFTAQADGGVQIAVDNVTALVGASVTIDLGLTGNTGMAGWKITIADTDNLGVFSEESVDAETLTFDNKTGLSIQDGNLKNGILVWFGSSNFTGNSMGALTFQIPDNAEPGVYHFTITPGSGDQVAKTADKVAVNLIGADFTVTVVDKVIDGMNVAIDAGTAIGVHVQTSDPDNTSITAVNVAGAEFATVDDYVADEENGGYYYYLNVSPWAMDIDFVVDFTEKFVIDGDNLDLTKLPATAKTTGILSYCNALSADEDTSDELKQLIADLLAFGQKAQIYNGAEKASFDLPEGLTATEAAWENGDGDPCSFGDFCSENFPEDITKKNSTAMKKFEFDYATIEFGSKFVVTFTFKNGATATDFALARVKANGETYSLEKVDISPTASIYNLTYAFNPAEYGGVEFDLYAAASTTATNFAWINNYGPAHFAAYLNDNYGEDAANILAILEAFYLYGASVEAYVATLG